MKIELDQIQESEVELREVIPGSSWEIDRQDVEFVDNISLACKIKRVGKRIFVAAEVVTYRKITCARCLNITKQIVTEELELSYDTNILKEYLHLKFLLVKNQR